ncbi:MAG TPA: family 10 glycosylhydrolase [Armatimonadota bacterium]|nr:family 10 glycosylhydrolase [Armatimonadota bacterium]
MTITRSFAAGFACVFAVCLTGLLASNGSALPSAGPFSPTVPVSPGPGESTAPTQTGPETSRLPPEARAMWVVRYSILTPAAVDAIVERAAKYHFNALMVQVRGRGDAYYESNIEPRAQALKDEPASFDPLARIIQKAHAHGIRVFAWVVTCLVWSGKHPPASPNHVVNQHPDWIDARYDGSPMSGTDYEGQFLNPALPEVRNYIVSVYRDLVSHYDIDGLHLDYIRYPAPGLGYNPEALAEFYASRHPGAGKAPPWELRAETKAHPAEWTTWRQQQVTELVREIRTAVQAEKPWISISAAVWSDLNDARYNRMQDWPTWLKDGLVDFVCPMAYSKSTPRVVAQIAEAQALSCGRQIWAGIGAWHLSAADTANKIRAVRKLGVAGVCLFSYGGMTHDGGTDRFLKALAQGPFHRSAAPPLMAWLPSKEGVQTARNPAAAPEAGR